MTIAHDSSKVEGNKYDDLETSRYLQKHIGDHIQGFSMFAFLEAVEKDDEGVSDKASERYGSGSNLSSISLNEFEMTPSEVENSELQFQESFALGITTVSAPAPDEVDWGLLPFREVSDPENDRILHKFL